MTKKNALYSLLVSLFIVFTSCQQGGKLGNLEQGEAPLTLETRIEKMAIDSEDNLLIAGYSTGNTLPLLISPQSDQVQKFYSFVSKLGPNGRVKWTTSLGNRRKNFVSAIQITPLTKAEPLQSDFFSTLPSPTLTTGDINPAFYIKVSPQGKIEAFSFFGNETRHYANRLSKPMENGLKH